MGGVTFPVQIDNGVGQAVDDVSGLVLGEETFPLQQLLQFASVAQLHDQINHLQTSGGLSRSTSHDSANGSPRAV